MSEETDGAPSGATEIETRPAVGVGTELVDLLGPPRLLKGEDADAYTHLTDQIRLAVTPKNMRHGD